MFLRDSPFVLFDRRLIGRDMSEEVNISTTVEANTEIPAIV